MVGLWPTGAVLLLEADSRLRASQVSERPISDGTLRRSSRRANGFRQLYIMCQQTHSMFTPQRSPFLQVLLGARLVTEILVVPLQLMLLLGITDLLHVPRLVTKFPVRRHPTPLAQCAVISRGFFPVYLAFTCKRVLVSLSISI